MIRLSAGRIWALAPLLHNHVAAVTSSHRAITGVRRLCPIGAGARLVGLLVEELSDALLGGLLVEALKRLQLGGKILVRLVMGHALHGADRLLGVAQRVRILVHEQL